MRRRRRRAGGPGPSLHVLLHHAHPAPVADHVPRREGRFDRQVVLVLRFNQPVSHATVDSHLAVAFQSHVFKAPPPPDTHTLLLIPRRSRPSKTT